MTNLPDFTTHGYQVTEQLYQNVQGGRITYKAIDIATQNPVVIKQFSFANKKWEGYKEIEREIDVLQGLNHAGIPKYLAKFDPGDGLCLVQEYINAQPLSKPRSFSPEDIKSIATQLLEILVYLQERIPPIFHRDIKPENILIGDNPPHSPLSKVGGIAVYLIDFGLARIGNNTMAFSSMMGGTMGFMSPEQVHGQKLTKASDLYGLGATLICLITQTKSANLGNLVDFSTNKITFKDLVPKYSFRFIEWLEKMVEPNPAKRYENAEEALNALKPLYVIRIPEVILSDKKLEFKASKLGEKFNYTIDISNSIPETILEGSFEVVSSCSDPLTMNNNTWINLSHQEIEGNDIKCKIIVDTSNLMAGKVYERSLELKSNASTEICKIPLKIRTAPIPVKNKKMPYFWLSCLLAVSFLLPLEITFFYVVTEEVKDRIEAIWYH